MKSFAAAQVGLPGKIQDPPLPTSPPAGLKGSHEEKEELPLLSWVHSDKNAGGQGETQNSDVCVLFIHCCTQALMLTQVWLIKQDMHSNSQLVMYYGKYMF